MDSCKNMVNEFGKDITAFFSMSKIGQIAQPKNLISQIYIPKRPPHEVAK